MTQILKSLALRIKHLSRSLRNAPLFVLAGAVSISVEIFAWGSILNENRATVDILGQTVRLAYAEVASSTAFSLLALWLAGAAAAFKADPRLSVRRRAGMAQVLACAVLIAPVYYAGSCLAYQRQLADWREYSGSVAEAADRDLAAGAGGVDSQVRLEAAASLRRGVRPERAEFDPIATAWIALLLGCNLMAVRLGWRPAPETPAEARARASAMRAAKARYTREQNKLDAAKAARQNVFTLRKA